MPEEEKTLSNTAKAQPQPNKLQDLRYIDVSNRKYHAVKRFFDVVISALALLVLIIPMSFC